MPDLLIVNMQQCSSSVDLQHFKIGKYEQTIFFCERGGYQECTCPAFKYSKKHDKMCKHLKQAYESVCTYHEQFDGPPKKKGVCPKCGKKTKTVRVGI